MGAISIDGVRLRSDGTRSKIRLRGRLIHLGPKTVLLLKGGGRGEVVWNKMVGEGRYQFRRSLYRLRMSYVTAGFYAYEISTLKGVVCEGRMAEELELFPSEDAADYALAG